ncbi:2OG-Fe dioxygenase family protein [Marinomonas ostreistagni]|uniref:2OG-Fe dioxygenase family protein n=1 Tax=Marinomonas ostreistagni TaxID=359209 RepID=UPI00194E516E|nr:2OG-Fe dioxygenase family protein [Marinomonas ostreistagni]MBM6552094.1 2OG-Fe dioxygenase family protein [Marinomonas ostreistagni]
MLTTKSAQQAFCLELGQLTHDAVDHLAPSFESLPDNPYADGHYRLRRYSRFEFRNDTLTRLPTRAFVQDASINHFQGDVKRTYPEIEDATVADNCFVELFEHFQKMADLPEGATIEVHQMRIFADHHEVQVAPEGIHQDGFDRIGIYVIQRCNIRGGEVSVHTGENAPALLKYPLDHGEFVVLNDKKFYHYATPIVPRDGELGYMDAFVLTANFKH